MVSRNPKSKQLGARRRIRSKRAGAALAAFVDAIERQYGLDLSLRPKRRKRQILTAKQAASLMRLSPKTLANWRNLGKGPAFYKIGARCIYRRADVVRFCRNRKSRSTSEYGTLGANGGLNHG
ncbi:hypothetical protein GGD81_004093 [Rhodobium orientis]|uniref:Helix-turn-helix domain-containing protein n=1 Tax=Rhodobium orientis TaxID=34017 RepID=A0A327JJ67_9HYPH|nr:helix-turn-helix domain-containing protein [Rhodobium orientis]MBB4305027.1 hypothetical protein [Rhodobium orientis]MBK5948766.1 hypothetical protein [Rhodobium orientis]RAI26470.1 hypothetical protein CH339_14165 [Rhodobium orientis]